MTGPNRRDFLVDVLAGSALVSFGGGVPSLLRQAAAATDPANASRVLVVIQLTGGNDGLNTVIPRREERYHAMRPTLAVGSDQQRTITDELALHPALSGIERLWEQSRLAIIQGVGYERPNRSHFESMDIWHTARREPGRREEGWLGRWAEGQEESADRDLAALHLGAEEKPLALAARQVRLPSIGSLERFRLTSRGDDRLRRLLIDPSPPDPSEVPGEPSESRAELLDFVQSSTTAAWSASRRIEQVLESAPSRATYPASQLAEKLSIVARLIAADLPTTVYYVTLDGFDTHAEQGEAHANLLEQWGSALAAFQDDLAAMGESNRVVTMTFSEFGRRVRENASEGTDHGAAAPVFLTGSAIQSGIVGSHPSFDDLEDGDLRFHTDFRQVYATLIERWLSSDSRAILQGDYSQLPIL